MGKGVSRDEIALPDDLDNVQLEIRECGAEDLRPPHELRVRDERLGRSRREPPSPSVRYRSTMAFGDMRAG